MSSAWWRTSCAPGGRSGCGATSLANSRRIRTDNGVLFVSFVANAECACHLALGWPLPARVLDLSPAFRNLTNGRSTPEGKGLIGALRYYGLDAIGTKQKDAMQKRIMKGWPFTPEEREPDSALLRQRRRRPGSPVAAHSAGDRAWTSRYITANLPRCPHSWSTTASRSTWRYFPHSPTRTRGSAVRDAMVPAIDAQYGVYVRNAAGEWSFSMERFEAYLRALRNRVAAA